MKKLACISIITAAMLAVPFGTAAAEEPAASSVEAVAEETAVSEVEEAAAEDTAASDAEAAADLQSDEYDAQTVSDSQTLDVCYSLALNAINAEDYEAAKDYLSVCFGYCDPEEDLDIYADLLLKQACINTIEGKNDLALRNLNAAIRMKPELADAYTVRAEVYVASGNADKAVADLEKYIELTRDSSMYATVAQLQEAKGDTEAAQTAYDKYVAASGEDIEEAGFQSGLYRMQNGSYEEAIEAFEAYTDNETYGAGALYNIGVCKMDLGDYAGAVEAFNACEEKGGSFEGLYYNRGVCHLLNGEWTEGAEDFKTSAEKESYVDDATYNLGICQMQQEDFETAIATFTDYLKDGETPEGEGETQSGEESEDQAVSGQPVNYGAYYYRAVCEGALGDLDGALSDYTVCIDNGYELTQSYYQRAQVYAALGDLENQNLDLTESLKYAE